MNQKQHETSNWLAHINNVTATKKSGTCAAYDKQGVPIILEWHKTNMMTSEFVALMASVSDLGIAAFTDVEMEFLHAFPEIVGDEPYFKPFEPHFKDGVSNVDWPEVEKAMRASIKGHFVFDITKFSDEIIKAYSASIFLCVQAKDAQTGKLLGYISYMVQPDFAFGTVKMSGIGVDPVAQKRGLGKLLISSIFKIVPDVQRIFLCTRVTNAVALAAYNVCGFIKDENPKQDSHYTFNLKHWVFMEYDAQKTDVLQKVAAQLAAQFAD